MGVPIGSALAAKKLATPTANPPAGSVLLYPKSDNKWYSKDSTGVETLVGPGGSSGATPTSGGVAYGDGTSLQYTAAGTTGMVLESQGANPPIWNDRIGWSAHVVTDWNTATVSGWYAAANTAANSPDANFYLGAVQAVSTTYVTQTVWAYSVGAAADTKAWRRQCVAGVWQAWYRIRLSETELSALYAAKAHTHGVADLTATGTRDSTVFLRGDNTWAAPPAGTTYTVPTQAEAEAGTATTARVWTAQRVAQAIAALSPVKSVAGRTGTVVLAKADVGLGSVDNTSDLAKPVSTATQTALNGKANTAHTHPASDLTATGTRDSSTFLRGDNTWAVPGGGMNAAFITDWDTAKTNGIYYTSASSTAHAPNTTDGWVGEVVGDNVTNWCTQTVMQMTTAATRLRYRREYAAGTWSSWVLVTETQPEQDARYTNASNLTSGTLPDARLTSRLKTTQDYAQRVTDWNTANQTGFYFGDSTAANAPSANNYQGLVEAWTDNSAGLHITQTLHQTQAGSAGQTWRREGDAAFPWTTTTWGSWYRLRVSQTELDALYARADSVPTLEEIAVAVPLQWPGEANPMVRTATGPGLPNAPLLCLPFACQILSVSFLFNGSVAESTTNYWTMELLRADLTDPTANIATFSTKPVASGGNGGIPTRDAWLPDTPLDPVDSKLAVGSSLYLNSSATGSPANLSHGLATVRYARQ